MSNIPTVKVHTKKKNAYFSAHCWSKVLRMNCTIMNFAKQIP